MPSFDPPTDLLTLRGQYDEIDALLEDGPDLLLGLAPEVSGWSALHHIAHIALANELVLRNPASLSSGRGALVVRGGEPHPRALGFLIEGRLPRGEVQAPRMVRPPDKVQRELLLGWLGDGRAAIASLDPAELVPSELKIPHQLLGPLDAPQWARFAVVHTQHHLLIARQVLAALQPEAD